MRADGRSGGERSLANRWVVINVVAVLPGRLETTHLNSGLAARRNGFYGRSSSPMRSQPRLALNGGEGTPYRTTAGLTPSSSNIPWPARATARLANNVRAVLTQARGRGFDLMSLDTSKCHYPLRYICPRYVPFSQPFRALTRQKFSSKQGSHLNKRDFST